MPTIRARSTRKAIARPRATIRRAYLHHLVKSGEALGAMLLTWNNLAYYQELMQDIRDAIEGRRFADASAEISEGWARGDLPAL